MAIQSVGGNEPTQLEGTAVATPGGATIPSSGAATASSDVTGEGKPYAVIEGQEFKTPEDLTKWWDSRPAGGDSTKGAASGNDTIQGGSGNDTLAASGNDTIAGGRSDDEIRESLKKAGGIYADERYEPFAMEFEKTGDLSADSIKKAAEVFGIPESFVSEFISNAKIAKVAQTQQAGQPTAEQVKLATAIVEIIPEEKDYRAVLAWGHENLSAEEQAAYDGALNRGDEVTAKALLKDFHQRFLASGNGPGPRDVTREGTGGGTPQATQGFASSAEMQEAMRDPRYAADPAYRRQVEQRVHASNFG